MKRFNQRKRVSILLVLLLAASLSGCGGDYPPASSGGAPDTTSGEAAGPVTLRILGNFDANIDPNNDPLKAQIENRTGYLLDYSMLPRDNADEKLSLEITSGSNYDVLMLEPQQFRTLARQNALMDIGAFVEQYGETMERVIPAETWELTKLDGKIYGVPQKNERPNIEKCVAMRKDMLDGAGVGVPTTLDEFYIALQAIHTTYPDVTPLTHYKNVFIPTLRSAFGLYSDWVERDGKLVHVVETPEIRDYYAFMIRLYNEGLLDKDLPVNKAANRDEKFVSGNAASMDYGWFDSDKITPNLQSNVSEAEIAIVEPLAGEKYEPGILASVRFLKASAVPKNARQAEDAVKFMNSKLEWDNFLYLTLGTEGGTFEMKDGKYHPIMPLFNEERGTAYYFLNGVDEAKYGEMWLARVRRNAFVGNTFDLLNLNFDRYAQYDPMALAPPLESVAKYSTSTAKMIDDYQIKLITGGESLDNYDAFLEQWRNAGGTAMSQEINKWYQSAQ